jgi:hypothetical protein
MILFLVSLLVRALAGLLVGTSAEGAKDVEILVLRHQVRVLRRKTAVTCQMRDPSSANQGEPNSGLCPRQESNLERSPSVAHDLVRLAGAYSNPDVQGQIGRLYGSPVRRSRRPRSAPAIQGAIIRDRTGGRGPAPQPVSGGLLQPLARDGMVGQTRMSGKGAARR